MATTAPTAAPTLEPGWSLPARKPQLQDRGCGRWRCAAANENTRRQAVVEGETLFNVPRGWKEFKKWVPKLGDVGNGLKKARWYV